MAAASGCAQRRAAHTARQPPAEAKTQRHLQAVSSLACKDVFFSRLLDDKEAEEVRISVVWVTSAL